MTYRHSPPASKRRFRRMQISKSDSVAISMKASALNPVCQRPREEPTPSPNFFGADQRQSAANLPALQDRNALMLVLQRGQVGSQLALMLVCLFLHGRRRLAEVRVGDAGGGLFQIAFVFGDLLGVACEFGVLVG